jgi:hypothetical protein
VALLAVVIATLAALVLAGLLWWRLRSIVCRVGSFECGVRVGDAWKPGIASYTRDHLVWYEVVSLSRRPRRRWDRGELLIVSRGRRFTDRRGRHQVEAICREGDDSFTLTAEVAAVEGLVSWLEAAPPGARHSHVI